MKTRKYKVTCEILHGMRAVKYLCTWMPLARFRRLIALLPNLALTIWLRLLFDKIFWTRGLLTPSYRIASRCFSFLDPTPLQWRNSHSITLSNSDIFKTSLPFFPLIFLTLKYFLFHQNQIQADFWVLALARTGILNVPSHKLTIVCGFIRSVI